MLFHESIYKNIDIKSLYKIKLVKQCNNKHNKITHFHKNTTQNPDMWYDMRDRQFLKLDIITGCDQ